MRTTYTSLSVLFPTLCAPSEPNHEDNSGEEENQEQVERKILADLSMLLEIKIKWQEAAFSNSQQPFISADEICEQDDRLIQEALLRISEQEKEVLADQFERYMIPILNVMSFLSSDDESSLNLRKITHMLSMFLAIITINFFPKEKADQLLSTPPSEDTPLDDTLSENLFEKIIELLEQEAEKLFAENSTNPNMRLR